MWRGAVAVFIYPNDRTSVFIKRVIGLPGDRIDIAGPRLRVNGQDAASEEGDSEIAAITVPPGFARPASEATAATTSCGGLWTMVTEADIPTLILQRRLLRPPASWSPTVRSSSSATIARRPSTPAASARCRWSTSRPSPAESGSRRTKGKALRWGRIGALIR